MNCCPLYDRNFHRLYFRPRKRRQAAVDCELELLANLTAASAFLERCFNRLDQLTRYRGVGAHRFEAKGLVTALEFRAQTIDFGQQRFEPLGVFAVSTGEIVDI